MHLELLKVGRGSIQIDKLGDDGGRMVSASAGFSNNKHYHDAAARLGVSEHDLWDAVAAFRKDGTTTHTIVPPVPQCDVGIRGIRESNVIPYPTFADALAARPEVIEPRIQWDNREVVRAVDVDFDACDKPNETALLCFAERVEPRPSWHWRTKSGGLRLIYLAYPPFGADELAAVAAYRVALRFPTARIELKNDTRHPAYVVSGKACGDVSACTPTCDASSMSLLCPDAMGSTGEGAAAEYLSSAGMEVGGRYPHGKCPINPDDRRAAGNSNPVVCYDDHIHCYICAADGVCHRSRTPGHFSYGTLTASAQAIALRSCVANFTHYAHAKYILRPILGRSAQHAEPIYRALLRTHYGDDPRIAAAFTTSLPVHRKYGYWVSEKGEPLRATTIKTTLEALPACQYIGTDGKLKIDGSKVAAFSEPIDLTEYGYPAVTTVRGHLIYYVHNDIPADVVIDVQPSSKLVRQSSTELRPKYVPAALRMPVEEAWETIETVFPGVPRNVIRLLIAARGYSEGQSGVAPMLFMYGPTGSGKTTCVYLAAAICGDAATTVLYAPQPERVMQGVRAAKDHGSFALFDEFVKQVKRGGGSSLAAMEMLLNFTPETLCHKLYIGMIPLGEMPVCVWCDTSIPPDVESHSQLARRLIAVHLPESHPEWEAGLQSSGLGTPDNLRLRGTPEMIAACNAILSDVIDEFFRSPTTFTECAASLGFARMDRSEVAKQSADEIRRFFDAVCAAPELTGSDAKRHRVGMKYINRDAGELAELWGSLADSRESNESRKLMEVDLRRVLGLEYSCRFDPTLYGRKLFVRFVSIDGKHTNEQLRKARPVELEPKQSCVDGLGNPIDAKPESGWSHVLSATRFDPIA